MTSITHAFVSAVADGADATVVQPSDWNDEHVFTVTANAQTGTSYTLLAADNGKIVTLNNAAAITLTIPSGLGAGFSCLVIQLGAGQVTVVAGGGATLNSYSSFVDLGGQYAMGTIVAPTANNFILGGQIA
jgi:hypothetical protein